MPDPPTAATRLSPRQAECLRLVYERKTTKEIAHVTGLAAGTVDTYIAEAVSALGARNRRVAAELLHELEAPEKLEPNSPWVASTPFVPPSGGLPERLGGWSDLLPLRRKGSIGNDLRPLLRLGWIVGLAALLSIGFGMLAVGIDVVSRLYSGR